MENKYSWVLDLIPRLREMGVSEFEAEGVKFTLAPLASKREPRETKPASLPDALFAATSMRPPKR